MHERGIALILTLIALALFSALGLGLLLASSAERLVEANHEDALHALNAAEAGLELAARELELVADWNQVLAGAQRARRVDGAPAGTRSLGIIAIDITALTNQLTCDTAAVCSDARRQAATRERPWGANNPRWQPFLYGPMSLLAPVPITRESYVIVWIGDDARERDGNPGVDDGALSGEGRDVVRAHAEAFAAGGTRRAVEADFVRPCQVDLGVRTCAAGIRVQSWRVRTGGLP